MQYRKLADTGIELSVIGFGGVVVMNETQEDANRLVADAFDDGVRYYDVAPGYGNAEEKLGPALEPFRDQVALACKTNKRTEDQATPELEASLTKARTDHFDIYQLHGLPDIDQARTALGDGGAIETLLRAKEQGKTRLIGFSAHDEEAAMLAIESGHFDTVLYPLNYVAHTKGGFGKRVLPAANARGMGIMALKAMARTNVKQDEQRPYPKCWYRPEDREDVAGLLLRYTLSLPGVTAAVAPGQPSLYQVAVDHADQATTPLSDQELATLEQAMADVEPLFADGQTVG